MPEASLILPTLNERDNIAILFKKLDAISEDFEIVIVDDASADGTAAFAEAYQGEHAVRVVRRPGKLGLSTAVIKGFTEAHGRYLIVMDADLSHDPSIVPQMLQKLRAGTDIVIGSRYSDGGGIVGWTLRRQVMSLVATWVAKVLLHVAEKDPMSGYFGLQRSVFDGVQPTLRPRGYKILLEILVRARPVRSSEVGFIFHDREHGKSKISGTVAWEYGRMLAELFLRKR